MMGALKTGNSPKIMNPLEIFLKGLGYAEPFGKISAIRRIAFYINGDISSAAIISPHADFILQLIIARLVAFYALSLYSRNSCCSIFGCHECL